MTTNNSSISASNKNGFVKREAIDFGFETAKKNISYFVSLFIIFAVVNIALEILKSILNQQHNGLVSFVYSIFSWIVRSVIFMGIIKMSLDFVEKKKPTLSDFLYTKPIMSFLGVSIVKNIIVVIGLVLFIIPGIIFAIKLQFSEYLVVDKGLGIEEALRKSWEITKGVKMNLFIFYLLLGLINLLGLIALLLGLFITLPLSFVANAYVYRKLLHQSQ